MKATNFDGQEFEVTDLDMMAVRPLGQPPEIEDDAEREKMLGTLLKGVLNTGGLDRYLPPGVWDCYLDEGDWEYPQDGKDLCDAEPVMTRTPDEKFDNVFLRLYTDVSTDGGMWDLRIHTRKFARGEDGQEEVLPDTAVETESGLYTPEACLRDLGALLAVFRIFVKNGQL